MNASLNQTSPFRHGLTLDHLACPGCHGQLIWQENHLACQNDGCLAQPKQWPVIHGAPVLLDESKSLLNIACFQQPKTLLERPVWKKILSRLFYFRPLLSLNVAAENNYRHLARLLEPVSKPLVLVIGCGEEGEGVQSLMHNKELRLIGLDLRWTKSVSLIADGQFLPFAEEIFDAVVLQGVLEHVLNPFLVEREVFRTLKPEGLIYCEFPFMQPNHGGALDFMRFTQMGHRRFWRWFESVDAGICSGPATALALVGNQFLRALLPFKGWPLLADWLADWTLWWLKYLDHLLIHTPAGVDGAAACYFLGRKGITPTPDQALLTTYRGGQ